MMGDYTEHLISMAGGDGDGALDLDAIQARRDSYLEGCSRHDDCLRSDMAALLALVREQAAQIERVRDLAAKWHAEYADAEEVTELEDRMDDEAYKLEDIIAGTSFASTDLACWINEDQALTATDKS